MFKAEILKNGNKYESLKIVAKKLDCSKSVVRKLCSEKYLESFKIGGSWFISVDSLPRGLRELQRKRYMKGILISKIRIVEKTSLKSKIRSIKRVVLKKLSKTVKLKKQKKA